MYMLVEQLKFKNDVYSVCSFHKDLYIDKNVMHLKQ